MRYDVAVVGAGPSGSWTARCSARRGARVLLIDPLPSTRKTMRRRHHRPRARARRRCPFAERPTARRYAFAPPDSWSRQGHSRRRLLAGGHACADGLEPRRIRRRASGSRAARGRRSAFACVADIHRVGGGFDGDASDGARITTPFVIGADGANSLVRRQVCKPFRREPTLDRDGVFRARRHQRRIVIEMFADPPGYIWSFPRPDHLAIGICAQADAGSASSSLRGMVRRWIESTAYRRRCPARSRTRGRFLHCRRMIFCRSICRPRLADRRRRRRPGDPITREGIFFALQSAVAAADATLRRHRIVGAVHLACSRRHRVRSRAERPALKPGFSDRVSRGCWSTRCSRARRSAR